MKKILLVVLLLLALTLTGCKKEKVALEDIYGKYDFVECVYVNSLNLFKIDQLNEMYSGKARYSLKENSFAFYESEEPSPSISLKLINYKETEINERIDSNDVKKLFKKASTRYDIYKLDVSQGYSFVFTADKVYFVEFRKLSNNVTAVWSVFEIEKRD